MKAKCPDCGGLGYFLIKETRLKPYGDSAARYYFEETGKIVKETCGFCKGKTGTRFSN